MMITKWGEMVNVSIQDETLTPLGRFGNGHVRQPPERRTQNLAVQEQDRAFGLTTREACCGVG